MKIAQVPPLYESVPPKLYGGTERIVSYLTEELVRQGHDVTIFGTCDSTTKATLVPVCEEALRLNEQAKDPFAWHIYQMQKVLDHADAFDMIHFHNDYIHYPFSRKAAYQHVTTVHGRLDQYDLQPIYKEYRELPLVSISDSQRAPVPEANWIGTIYHGLPETLFHCGEGKGGYVAFLGRISPEKGPERAIEIALKAEIPIKIAAKIERADIEYFEKEVKPLLHHPLVEFVGEINEIEKQDFLGNAAALLFPINWPEPFGLVMIESMACGTPVIATRYGSVPEVIEHGRSGYVVDTIDEAVAAVDSLDALDRPTIRKVFEECFTSPRMASTYVQHYERLVNAGGQQRKHFVNGVHRNGHHAAVALGNSYDE